MSHRDARSPDQDCNYRYRCTTAAELDTVIRKVGMYALLLKGRVSSNDLLQFGLSQFTIGVKIVHGVHCLTWPS